jgi:glutathione S-transferase
MVPVLRLGTDSVWDTVAIAEWAHENSRSGPLWPAESLARAQARSAMAEMHSGFSALRAALPMNIRGRYRAHGLSMQVQQDIARIDEMWSGLCERHRDRGPYLFGSRCIADAFYVPVATRMRTYSVTLSDSAQVYCRLLLSDADFLDWEARAIAEPAHPFPRAKIDDLYPRA